MTNLEFIKTLSSKEFVKFVFDKTEYMCMQRGDNMDAVYEKWCYPHNCKYKNGCEQCRIDWLNAEVGETEKAIGIDNERSDNNR